MVPMVLSEECLSLIALTRRRRLLTPAFQMSASHPYNPVLKTYNDANLDVAPEIEQLSITAISLKACMSELFTVQKI
jgi:hypothetical protein